MTRKNKAIIIIFTILILTLFVLGLTIDRESLFNGSEESSQKSKKPYIEVVQHDEEQFLVGSVVQEWTKWETSATDLYDKYRQQGRLYAVLPITIQYAIYNVSDELYVVQQELALSVNPDFSDAKTIEIDADKRSVQLNYLFTDTEYYYRITASLSNGNTITEEGRFKTAKSPRIIEIGGLRNVRDIGGWETVDGKTIKQGLLYRGCELDGAKAEKYVLTDDGKATMLDELGIKTELDLRGSSVSGKAVLGDQVEIKKYSFLAYTECFTEHGREQLRKVFVDLSEKENYPIYLHCSYGADRTGTICYFIEAILGLSEENLYREWELSILCNGGAFYEEMDEFTSAFKLFEGNTM